jgi:hypothetical protein
MFESLKSILEVLFFFASATGLIKFAAKNVDATTTIMISIMKSVSTLIHGTGASNMANPETDMQKTSVNNGHAVSGRINSPYTAAQRPGTSKRSGASVLFGLLLALLSNVAVALVMFGPAEASPLTSGDAAMLLLSFMMFVLGFIMMLR